jgi:Domain of unknown function (DUF4398)
MRLLSKRPLVLRATTTGVVLAALIVGCAAPTEHPALDQAGAAVERARSAARVRALAAAELDRAEVALEHARAAAWAGAPPDQVEHLAYVVSQRVALAEARAAERIARSEIGKLQGALGQALADGRLERGGFTRVPLRNHPQRRGLSQKRLEQDRPARASSAQQDQQADVPLEEHQHERESVQQEQETRAPLEQDQLKRALVQQDPQTHVLLEEDQSERALGQLRLKQDRPARASSAQPGQQADALLKEDRHEGGSVQQEQEARTPLEQDQHERASVQQDPQTRARMEEGQTERTVGQARLEQDRQAWGSRAQPDQQADASLKGDRHERESVQQEQETRAPLEQDQHERASVQQDQQTSGPLETDRLERAPLEVDPSERALLEQDQRERASVNEDQQARASVEEHQDAATTAPDNGTTMVGTIHQGITLSLAQLQFEGAEPTSDTLAELAVLAERLLSERGRSILIEADFDLPDPEARTEMERRVEAVRAILVRRGIEPARLVVRAAGDAPADPPASSSFGEPPD